jgi:hypothetical protein
MTVLGKWRIVEMPDYEDDYPDMVEPAYLLFAEKHGEFAFGCVTGQIFGGADANLKTIEFSWAGNDEMEEASGSGWAEIQPDGSLTAEIAFHNGDEITISARRWGTSSTAC